MLACLILLTTILFLLTLYSILQANSALFENVNTAWLSFKILDTPTAATLFVTALGALLVRHQFALSLLPRINYKSALSKRQNSQDLSVTFETWRVEMRNTGLGSAIINRTEYLLALPDAGNNILYYHTFDKTIKELGQAGLIRGTDYWLENITPGFSLSPKDECPVFEIKTEHISKINRLDLVLYFQGQLGDKYCREIFFIPRGFAKE